MKIIIYLINFYQAYLSFDRGILSYFAPFGACRYDPTCSEYTKQMIIKFGIGKGILLGLKRILLCNPFVQANFVK